MRIVWLLALVSVVTACAVAPRPVVLPETPVQDLSMTEAPRHTSPLDVDVWASLRASEPAMSEVSPQASRKALAWAESRATVRPSKKDFRGAEVQYRYIPGKIWQIETVPFEPIHLQFDLNTGGLEWSGLDVGEHGWWEVKSFQTGVAPHAQGHLLVLAKAVGKAGKMTVVTDLGRFYLAFRSRESAGVTAVSWTHPAPPQPTIAHQTNGVFYTGYTRATVGLAPVWTPTAVWDTGTADGRTLILFPMALQSTEAPLLWVVARNGEKHLVNYTVRGRWYIVDQLFERAELRVGPGDNAEVILIERGSSYRGIRCPGDDACPPGGWS